MLSLDSCDIFQRLMSFNAVSGFHMGIVPLSVPIMKGKEDKYAWCPQCPM